MITSGFCENTRLPAPGEKNLYSFDFADHTLIGLDFRYGEQILAALLTMALTVVFHSLGISAVHRFFKRFGHPIMRGPYHSARIGSATSLA